MRLNHIILLLFLLHVNVLKAQSVDSLRIADSVSAVLVSDKAFVGENDTIKLNLKSFDADEIKHLKNDSDFNYKEPPTIAESLWQRFLQIITWFIASLLKGATTSGVGKILLYTVAAVVVIVIVMTLLKVNAFKVLYSGADQPKSYLVFHENIHEMNFELLIKEAIEQENFRLATRLVFLNALKILSDNNLIHFTPGKTNHDYVEELGDSNLKKGLNELSYFFDYAWYGNFSISRSQFERVQKVFLQWRNSLIP